MRRTILVTNDDGIYGPGLRPLINELKKVGKVVAIVPDQDMSGVSHSITLHEPLRASLISKNLYAANGTPADCVRFGLISLLKRKVDLVVSGINTGPNLGQDVVYSGTVAGAREGALLGVPSFAVSVSDMKKPNFHSTACYARRLARLIFKNQFPNKIYLNVNIPYKIKGTKITSLGQRIYDDEIQCRLDPRGKKYYWLAGKSVSGLFQSGMDLTAVKNGFVSITPLRVTPTATDMFERLSKWIKKLK
ncbi:MAG: 5'/3'-nucleotidase SurE [Endomicrobiales bacterium]|nr:5'/3'-nucleotidase SurE [Endomicrobiales bacterium]